MNENDWFSSDKTVGISRGNYSFITRKRNRYIQRENKHASGKATRRLASLSSG